MVTIPAGSLCPGTAPTALSASATPLRAPAKTTANTANFMMISLSDQALNRLVAGVLPVVTVCDTKGNKWVRGWSTNFCFILLPIVNVSKETISAWLS
jgi:hypothetical protein